MAFLLLLHQKMKLQRKENELTLKQLRFSSKVDRMQKKVDKRQKYYDKLRKQIERQANCYKNQANIFFSQQMGLGLNSVDLSNPYGSNGAVQLALQNVSLDNLKNMLGEEAVKAHGDAKLQSFLDAVHKGGLTTVPCNMDKDAAARWLGDRFKDKIPNEGFTKNQVIDNNCTVYPQEFATAYSQLQQQAQMQVSSMQQYATKMKSQYENNVSIWTEAQLEQLEYQEQSEMDLLAEEQADMEAEKNSVEVQLQRVQEEKKNIEQALGNAIQDSAPKFGLA